MVVLNQNLFKIDPESIIDTKVVYTILPAKLFMMQKCRNKNIAPTIRNQRALTS